MDVDLKSFVAESNRIEGIVREPTDREIKAHQRFIGLGRPEVTHMEALVWVLQPGALLRDRDGLNVRVDRHIAPAGGPDIRIQLEGLLDRAALSDPYTIHLEYETLHPFTDGNGRSGRALWLWMMLRGSERDQTQALQLGFLHCFYYQSLAHGQS